MNIQNRELKIEINLAFADRQSGHEELRIITLYI